MDRILKQALDITTTQQGKCVAVGLSSLEGGYKPCDGVYRTAILCKQFSNSSKGVQDKFEDGLMKAQNCPKLSANRAGTVCQPLYAGITQYRILGVFWVREEIGLRTGVQWL